jgi:hypothetical protein
MIVGEPPRLGSSLAPRIERRLGNKARASTVSRRFWHVLPAPSLSSFPFHEYIFSIPSLESSQPQHRRSDLSKKVGPRRSLGQAPADHAQSSNQKRLPGSASYQFPLRCGASSVQIRHPYVVRPLAFLIHHHHTLGCAYVFINSDKRKLRIGQLWSAWPIHGTLTLCFRYRFPQASTVVVPTVFSSPPPVWVSDCYPNKNRPGTPTIMARRSYDRNWPPLPVTAALSFLYDFHRTRFLEKVRSGEYVKRITQLTVIGLAGPRHSILRDCF